MAESNIVEREFALFLGEESTFGVTPASSFPNAMTRTTCLHGDVLVGDLQTEMLDVPDVRVRRDDNPAKVRGLQIGSKVGAIKWHLKEVPEAAQLVAAATPAALTPRLVWRHGIGTEHAAAGTTISGSGSTDTELDVASAAAIKKGTWCAVIVAGEWEWFKVLDVDTGATPDRITIAPPLSAAPATGAAVKQLYNYTRRETNTRSLTVQQAYVGDTTAQHTANGCYGELSFEWPEFGKLPTMALSLTATRYVLGSQALSVAPSADEMGAAGYFAPSVYLAEPGDLDRAEPAACEALSIEFVEAVEMVRDPSATQTVHSVLRVGGRPVAVKASLKVRFDHAVDDLFAAGTDLQYVVVQRYGSGTTATLYVWELPRARIVGQPKRVKVGERLYVEIQLEGLIDDAVTLASETGDDLDRILSSFRFAAG